MINNAQLLHGDRVITGHYFNTVRDISTERPPADHIRTTNSWNQGTYITIDWEAYQRSQNSMN
eukprot:7274628-Ditylum_brightwellii.AAC.2